MPMSAGQRKLLHYSGYVHPVVCLLIGAVFLIGPFWFTSGEPADLQTVALLGGLGVAFLGYGAFALRRQLKQDPTTPVYTVDDLPAAEGARQTRRIMWLLGTILTFGSAFMAYQLAQVEFGGAPSATVWGPVALMYELFGFWPAVLLVPVLGVLILFSLARKLRALKEGQTGRI
jgi:hypothetical protein